MLALVLVGAGGLALARNGTTAVDFRQSSHIPGSDDGAMEAGDTPASASDNPPPGSLGETKSFHTSFGLEIPLYSEGDWLMASSEQVEVSPESPVAQVGDITVDFHQWNLADSDHLLVNRLPDKVSRDGTLSVRGYDFTLQSGQSTFLTAVTAIIPRTVEAGMEGYVMLLDPEKGTWAPIGHEETEDGTHYRVDMPHFSTVAEIRTRLPVGAENDINNTDGDLTTKGSLYQYLGFSGADGLDIPLLQRSVYMSDSSFRKLFMSVETSELERLLRMAELPSRDTLATALGTLNNATSAADAAMLLGRLEKGLSIADATRFSDKMAGFGGMLTIGRIAYQANKGGNFAAILLDNKYNILEGILGGLSYGAQYVGAAGASTAFSAASAVVFAWSLATGYHEAVTEFESLEEKTYRFFLDQNRPRFSIHSMRVGLEGDYPLGLTGENHAQALKAIHNAHTGNPKALDGAVARFYEDYASLFWTALTAEQRSDYCYKEYLGSPIVRPVWQDPQPEAVERFTRKVVAISVSESETILRALAMDALREMQLELYDTVKRQIEPLLNEIIVFRVIDPTLEKGETFFDSPYASHPIEFADRTSPQFLPRFIPASTYGDGLFMPQAAKDTDVVFICTLYHYIQMGCPTEMLFKGNPAAGLPEMKVAFSVENGEAVVLLEPSEQTAFSDFADRFSEDEPLRGNAVEHFPYALLEQQLPEVIASGDGNALLKFQATQGGFVYTDPLRKIEHTVKLQHFKMNANLRLTLDNMDRPVYMGEGTYSFQFTDTWSEDGSPLSATHAAEGALRINPLNEERNGLPKVEFHFTAPEVVTLQMKGKTEVTGGNTIALVAACFVEP